MKSYTSSIEFEAIRRHALPRNSIPSSSGLSEWETYQAAAVPTSIGARTTGRNWTLANLMNSASLSPRDRLGIVSNSARALPSHN